MSDGKLARNTTYYTGAMTIQKILAFIYFWFISNNLFPAQLGQYIFALSFTTLFSIFVDLGLSPILIREAAKNQAQANLYLKNVLGLKHFSNRGWLELGFSRLRGLKSATAPSQQKWKIRW